MSRLSPAGRLSLEILIALALLQGVLGIVRPRLGPAGHLGLELGLIALLVGPLLVWRLTRAWRARELAPGTALCEALSEDEQAAALAVTTALARAGDVAEAAAAVNDALERSTGLTRTAVLLFQEDGVCRFVGWRGLSEAYRRAVEGHCPWKQDQAEAEPIVIQDAAADPGMAAYRELFAREGIACLAFLPIMGKGGVVGKLMLYGSEPRTLSASAVRAAHVVAVSLGTAVTRLRMAEALARSESRLRAVIDTAMDAVVSMDCAGRVAGWNAQAEAILGWSASEALGRPLEELVIPAEQRAAHRTGLERHLATGESRVLGKRIEVPAVRRDGTRITVELSIAPVHTADGLVFSAFLRDISAQKRAADELIEARAAAEAANHAKSEFLANMSHEIRTPLTAILGYAELLRDDGDLERAPERRLATIDTIHGAGQHLLTVINDILDLSKIEAGRMTVEMVETPLLGLLQEVESLMRPRASEKSVALTTRLASALPERVYSDPTRLRQILVNLAGNAVKFTAEGRITLVARTEPRGGAEWLVIDVEDTGPGLTPAQCARLFTPFGQADASVTRRHGGTGLGLTISHRLAELLGGTVALQRTEPGKGSCFRLELPLRAVPGAPRLERLVAVGRSLSRSSAAQPALDGRILLAEDGRDNQYIIAFYLRRSGAEVDVAPNGRVALEKIEAAAAEGRPYPLLLTDIQMPEMDGYTLARELRARGHGLAIVALTAHAMAEDRQRCLDAGCDDYAVKPIDKARLLATCAQWLEKRRA